LHVFVFRAQNLQTLLSQFDQPEETDLLQVESQLAVSGLSPRPCLAPALQRKILIVSATFYEMEEEFELATSADSSLVAQKILPRQEVSSHHAKASCGNHKCRQRRSYHDFCPHQGNFTEVVHSIKSLNVCQQTLAADKT